MRSTRFATMSGVLLCVSCAAQAQPASSLPDPSAPDAPVPALAHVSVLDAPARPASTATPDQAWRPANAALAAGPASHAHHAAEPAQGQPAPHHQHQHQHQQDGAHAQPAPGHDHATREQP